MSKTLLALPVLAAACIDHGPVAIDPNVDHPSTPIAFDQLQIGDASIVVATGGVQTITIPAALSVGWSAAASDGFDVEPDGDVWPNTRKPVYRVRALADETGGTFAIATNNGVATGSLASAELARLAVLPADYKLDGHSPVAFDTGYPSVEVALFDQADRRLIDGSLTIAGTQIAWDRATLTFAVGHHELQVSGDSLPATALGLDVVDRVDRIEKVIDGGRACFHAYAGAVEVAQPMPMIAQHDPTAVNCEAP
jgi:hypothetical protein